MSVTAITVSHNSNHVLPNMIHDLLAQSMPLDKIIVVDSGSSNVSELEILPDAVQIIPLSTNVGFGAACNKGAAAADTRYVFFINPDTRLGADTIRCLYEVAEANRVDVLGPRIVGPTGLELPAPDKFPRVPFGRRLAGGCHLRESDRGLQSRFLVPGSAMLIRTDIFRSVGGFDERFFLYMEEIDLQLRILETGGYIARFLECSIEHAAGQSSSSVTIRWAQVEHLVAHTLFGLKNFSRAHAPLICGFDLFRVSRLSSPLKSIRQYFLGVRSGLRRCGS